MKEPWKCPYCSVVYAPNVTSCRCETDNKQHSYVADLRHTGMLDNTSALAPDKICNHVWDKDLTIPVCKNCNASAFFWAAANHTTVKIT